MFVSHMLMNKKFEHLCSFYLSERQTEITKDFLSSSENGMFQLYYLSFIATRASPLEGLKHAQKFLAKLKSEAENVNRRGSEEAGIMARVVENLINMYSHSLTPLQKKFAFEYLNLEPGKLQIAFDKKSYHEENMGIKCENDMDVDNRLSSDFSDQGKYTPFLNRKVGSLMKSQVPQIFADPYNLNSERKNDGGSKSVVKMFKKKEEPKNQSFNIMEGINL